MHRHSSVPAAVRLAVGVFASAGLVGLASAQEVEEELGALDEIVVTAQFREQNVQQTPLAITAISADMLEARSQTSIQDVASQAPSVTLRQNSAAFGPSLGASIRGVGQFDFNPALEPGVGMYVDDVYYASLTGSILDLLDLERVEILRGPQGTLAGKNSIGGAVKLYSKKPGGDGGYVSATYGSRDRLDLRGSADFALSENVFARVSAVSKEQRGHVQIRDYGCDFPNSGVPVLRTVGTDCVVGYGGEVNYSAARGSLRWIASDTIEVNTSLDFTRDDRAAAAGVLITGSSAVNPNVQPVPGVTSLSVADFVPPKGSYYNYANYYNPGGTFTYLSGANTGTSIPAVETRADGRVSFQGWGWSGTVDWKAAERLSLKSITAYREYDSYQSNDNDLSPLANSLGFGYLTFHSFSQELRASGALLDDDRLEYTVGAFYMDQRSIYSTTQDLRYSATSLTQFSGRDPVNADTFAVFSHLSYLLTDKFTVNAGLRYTDEHKDYTFVRRTRTGEPHPALGAIDGVTTNYDGDKFDYRLNFQYQWTPAVMTYAQVATGFKGGGVSPRPFSAAQARPFNPEELTSYEVGVKSDLFDRRLRLNVAGFFSDYTEMQISLSSCPQYGVGLPCALMTNSGEAEMKGIEVETVYRPIDNLSIDASFNYIDFKYTYIDPAAGAGGPQYGMYPTNLPRSKWSVGAQYEFFIGDIGSLTTRFDVNRQADSYGSVRNGPTSLIPAYTLANARVTWRNPDNTWEASLEALNITDEYYYVSRFDQYTLTGVSDAQVGRPREYALTIKRRF
jgi:iron complex outermembrane receptor protein